MFWSANAQAFARKYEILIYFVYYFTTEQSRVRYINCKEASLRLLGMSAILDHLSLEKFKDRTKVDFNQYLSNIRKRYLTIFYFNTKADFNHWRDCLSFFRKRYLTRFRLSPSDGRSTS